jgi:dsDNA-binding SOS-regulon protein
VDVYVVVAEGPEIEAVFADRAVADRYATMGDMWVESWPVSESLEDAQPAAVTRPTRTS